MENEQSELLEFFSDSIPGTEILNTILNPIIITDMEGNIYFMNKKAENKFGWKLNEVKGKNIIHVTPSDMSIEQAEEIINELSHGKVWSGEFNLQTKEGKQFPAIVTDAPIYNKKGKLIGIIGMTQDISALKCKFEQDKILDRQAIKKLYHDNMEKLTTGLTNALSSNLNNLQSNLKYLENHLPIKDNSTDILQNMQNSIDEIFYLIHQLQVYAGHTSLEVQQVNISEFFSNLVLFIRNNFNCVCDLITEIDENDFFEADSHQLKQVILELIQNSIRAVDFDQYQIEIKLKLSEVYLHQKDIYQILFCKNLIPGNYLKISIQDNGKGIHEKFPDRLFTPFITTDIQNDGFGLSYVKGIIESHKGGIDIVSEIYTGTEISLYLPLHSVDLRNTMRNKPNSKTNRFHKILIVDDNEMILNTYHRIFSSTNVEILTANDELIAMNKLKKYHKKLDLIMIDLSMSIDNKIAFYSDIVNGYPNIPILIIGGDMNLFENIMTNIDQKLTILENPFSKQELFSILKEKYGIGVHNIEIET